MELLEFEASIVSCVDENTLDPEQCLDDATFTVDLFDEGVGAAKVGFIRFDLPEDVLDRTVLDASLFLTMFAGSAAESGEIWQTDTFVAADLTSALPPTVGDFPLAPTILDVTPPEELEFELSADVVQSSDPFCMAVVPTHTNGVEYWGISGKAPPRLAVLVQ